MGWIVQVPLIVGEESLLRRIAGRGVPGKGLCPCRKSNPHILVVQPAENWRRHNTTNGLDGT